MVRAPLFVVGLLAGLAAGGCATPVTPAWLAQSGPAPEASLTPLEPSYPAHGLSRGEGPTEALPDALWQVVLADLQDLGEVDPDAQFALIEELKQVQPVHYPLVVQQFRTAWLRRAPEVLADARATEAAEQTLPLPADEPSRASVARHAPPTPSLTEPVARPLASAAAVSREAARAFGPPSDVHAAMEARDLGEASRATALADLQRLTLAATAAPSDAAAPPAEAAATRTGPAASPPPLRTIGESPSSRVAVQASASWVSDTTARDVGAVDQPPRPALDAARRAFEQQQSNSLTDAALRPSHYVPDAQTPQAGLPADPDAWRLDLERAIEGLGAALPDAPRTVDELHDHLRLRNLLLLADRPDEALEAIPGAGVGEQAFWSKQLFAMQAFLDAGAHADQRQRAAAALVHYEEARAQLAELATLRVRNAAFVERVDGFGAYDPLAKTAFKPGQQVNVYAEVENYRSESTRDGYRTVLATSYQVVDEAGRRVDGGEFPEVEDVCLSRRRDFHMQYAIPLPDRIYPGPYALELVITDRLSNKIGSQRIAFEIAE